MKRSYTLVPALLTKNIANKTLALSPLAAIAGSLLLGGSVQASSLALRESSIRSGGMAMAADGVNAGDASSIFTNPASVGSLKKGQTFSLGLNSINVEKTWEGTSSTATSASGRESINKSGTVPNVAGVNAVSDDLSIAWGYFAPFGGSLEYNKDWFGRYYGVNTLISMRSLDASVAYRVSDEVTVAGGLQYQMANTELSSAVDLGTMGPLLRQPAIPGQADALASFSGESKGYGYLLGVNVKPSETVTVGVGFRSQVNHTVKGDTNWEDQSEIGGKFRMGLSQGSSFFQGGDSTLDITAPQVTTVGVKVQATTDVQVFANVNQTKFSSISALNIKHESTGTESVTQLNMNDTVSASVGTQVNVTDQVLVRGGIGYDPQSTSKALLSVRGVDGDRMIYAVGSSYVTGDFSVDAAVSYYDINAVDVKQSRANYSGNNLRGDIDAKTETDVTMYMIGGSLYL